MHCLGVWIKFNVFKNNDMLPVLQFGGGSGELLMEEITPELMRKNMTEAEWAKIYEMNKDRNLFQNLINSLFPSVHGNDQVKKGK